MNLKKEYYAWEAYFLTRYLLNNGEARWVNNHKINFSADYTTMFPAFMELVKKVIKHKFKAFNITNTVRVNVSAITVNFKHPLIEGLATGADVPAVLKQQFDDLFVGVPIEIQLPRYYTNPYPNLPSVSDHYVRSSRLVPFEKIRFRFALYTFIPMPRDISRQSPTIRKKWPAFLGWRRSFCMLPDIIENFITDLNEMYNRTVEILSEDMQAVSSCVEPPVQIIVRDVQDIGLGELIRRRQETPF